ncbi:hypothetical protein [Motilimonas cestriensis]|uniref:hypothetical protein n=1 Tax=Motilimonas cestriensis TaxID=2742685 RepID=UPI003DA2D199
MNFKMATVNNTAWLALPVLGLLSACTPMSTEEQVAAIAQYQDQLNYQVASSQLFSSLQHYLAPVAQRNEQGKVAIQLTGPNLSTEQLRQLDTQLSQWLQLPVSLHRQTGAMDYQVNIAVTLQQNSCRFSQYQESLSVPACAMRRNMHSALVKPATWHQGEEYVVSSSALDVGAVQRLFDGKIKMSDKQQVTGD